MSCSVQSLAQGGTLEQRSEFFESLLRDKERLEEDEDPLYQGPALSSGYL